MTPEGRLKEIAERAERATPGPWHSTETAVFAGNEGQTVADMAFADDEGECSNNAIFTAYAREDIPYLLEQVAALQAERDQLQGAFTATHEIAVDLLTRMVTEENIRGYAARLQRIKAMVGKWGTK